jgi:ubiquinone/menaquinone biosynthesis C-methylase UbiE
MELFLYQYLHNKTKRNYIERMLNDKVNCMIESKKYDVNYWDGDRKYGYGGYYYIENRLLDVAKSIIDRYSLTNSSNICDYGCGKGFLLYEIKKLLPKINLIGIDISKYAVNNSMTQVSENLKVGNFNMLDEFENNYFDLIISVATLHNLKNFELKHALNKLSFVSKNQYIMLESYRNEFELFNLQCWALTAQTFLSKEEWVWLFNEYSYLGDYEFIYFE